MTTHLTLIAHDAPAPTADELDDIETRVRAGHRKVLADIVAIGADLIRAKELLPHGGFLPWVQEKFAWTPRTAQTYMRIAEGVGTKCERISHLPLKIVTALVADKTPPEIREQVFQRAEAGEQVATGDVEELLTAARYRARQIRLEALCGRRRGRPTPEQLARATKKQEAKEAASEKRRAAIDTQVMAAITLLRARLSPEDLETLAETIRSVPHLSLGFFEQAIVGEARP